MPPAPSVADAYRDDGSEKALVGLRLCSWSAWRWFRCAGRARSERNHCWCELAVGASTQQGCWVGWRETILPRWTWLRQLASTAPRSGCCMPVRRGWTADEPLPACGVDEPGLSSGRGSAGREGLVQAATLRPDL